MYSTLRALGEPQVFHDLDIYRPDGIVDDGNMLSKDFDLIAVNYYSPDSDYPSQRITNYNVPLAEHQTLEGPGRQYAKLLTRQHYLTSVMRPGNRLRYGRTRTSMVITPRFTGANIARYGGYRYYEYP